MIAKGETLPNVNEGGYDKIMVQSSPFGAGASEPAKAAADFRRTAEGQYRKIGHPEDARPLRSGSVGTNYLIEGVVGSIS